MRNLVLAAATCGIMLASTSSFASESTSWIHNFFTSLNISATLGIEGTNASSRGIEGTNDDGASTKGIEGTNDDGGASTDGIEGTN